MRKIDTKTVQRYWSKVDKKSIDECWAWLGLARAGKSRKYGQFWFGGNITAHRFSWVINFGKIPKGLHVLHHCDNPICQNPKHLFVGTNEDNIRDKMAKGRWSGGHPKFIPAKCKRCGKLKRIIRGHCKSCYSTLRRQLMGRNVRGPSPF